MNAKYEKEINKSVKEVKEAEEDPDVVSVDIDAVVAAEAAEESAE